MCPVSGSPAENLHCLLAVVGQLEHMLPLLSLQAKMHGALIAPILPKLCEALLVAEPELFLLSPRHEGRLAAVQKGNKARAQTVGHTVHTTS